MSVPVRGRVHGSTIELDAPVPPLEGKRVLAILELVEQSGLDAEEQRAAWAHWVAKGPQGPFEDDGDEFP